MIIGGAANGSTGKIYEIGVIRGAGGHITGFSGTATVYSDGAYNDGGVVFGPGGVLFLARWPVNETRADQARQHDHQGGESDTAWGWPRRPVASTSFPPGFPGAGQFKVVSYDAFKWYTVTLAADGSGTYNLTSATEKVTLSGGPEGFIYVPAGSPLFPDYKNILLSEYKAGVVSTYTIDANGDPIANTRAPFITGLTGAEGAVTDPVDREISSSRPSVAATTSCRSRASRRRARRPRQHVDEYVEYNQQHDEHVHLHVEHLDEHDEHVHQHLDDAATVDHLDLVDLLHLVHVLHELDLVDLRDLDHHHDLAADAGRRLHPPAPCGPPCERDARDLRHLRHGWTGGRPRRRGDAAPGRAHGFGARPDARPGGTRVPLHARRPRGHGDAGADAQLERALPDGASRRRGARQFRRPARAALHGSGRRRSGRRDAGAGSLRVWGSDRAR